MINILAISGSLRNGSSNTNILKAAMQLVPAGAAIRLYDGIGSLPHFNPDLLHSPPDSVTGFREELQLCDALLISTPEYAHGVPGVLKNALDWIVSSGELIDKPVAMLNLSYGSTHAAASLTETITVMMGRIITEACIRIQLPTNKIDDAGILADKVLTAKLKAALDIFIQSIYQIKSAFRGH